MESVLRTKFVVGHLYLNKYLENVYDKTNPYCCKIVVDMVLFSHQKNFKEINQNVFQIIRCPM